MWGEAVPARERERTETREGREAERPKSGVEHGWQLVRKVLQVRASGRFLTLS